MKVLIKNARGAFLDSLWTAEEYEKGDGKPRHSATFLIVPGDANDKAIRAAIDAVGSEVFKAKWLRLKEAWEKNPNKFCYQDGDTKNWDGAGGMMVLAAHRKAKDGRPTVLNLNKSPVAENDGIIYGGCYINGSVDIWAQDGENSGIRCTLLGVQYAGEGDSFSGARRSDDSDFEDLSDTGGEAEDADGLGG